MSWKKYFNTYSTPEGNTKSVISGNSQGIDGMAKVVNGEQDLLIATNESTFIPAGHRHRLENPGKIDLVLIEVQSGAYLGEDDIVRFEDHYGRV